MDKLSKDTLKGVAIVPAGLTLVLIPYSMLIGWNLATLVLFWFLIIPGLTLYLPTLVSNNKSHLLESLVGLVIFYSFMVFMTYKLYDTDHFKVMMVSCMVNAIVVLMSAVFRKTVQATQ